MIPFIKKAHLPSRRGKGLLTSAQWLHSSRIVLIKIAVSFISCIEYRILIAVCLLTSRARSVVFVTLVATTPNAMGNDHITGDHGGKCVSRDAKDRTISVLTHD